MANTLNPSFRRPNVVPSGAAHPTVISAIFSHDQSITDLNQAIASLKSQIGTSSSSSTSSGKTTNTTTATENVTNVTYSGGVVNNQSGNTSYTTAFSDNGAFIIFDDASPVAVTLNNALTPPFYSVFINLGTGVVTLTPQQGQINNAANLVLAQNSFTAVAYDGSSFWAEPLMTAGVTQIEAGTNITISPSGGTGVVTINATGSLSSIYAAAVQKTAAVASTTLLTTPTGQYSSYSITQALNAYVAATGTVAGVIGWTDTSGTVQTATININTATLGSASRASQVLSVNCSPGTAITYAATITGTPTYDLTQSAILLGSYGTP